MLDKSFVHRFYPPIRFDGTRRFYDLVRTHLDRSMKVLDLGCGLPSRNPIKRLKGEAARVVGADIDPAAQSNDEVDEVVIFSGRILPFDSGDFDIVVCDYVMEHIEEPSEFLKEIHRVLRHPGYLFFRTPSKYHYVAMMTRVIPNSWHNNISLRLRGMSNDNHKTYPTFYKFNSKRDIFRHSISSGFSRHCIDIKFIECEPSYLLANRLTFAIGMGYERIVNSTELLSALVHKFGNIFSSGGRPYSGGNRTHPIEEP